GSARQRRARRPALDAGPLPVPDVPVRPDRVARLHGGATAPSRGRSGVTNLRALLRTPPRSRHFPSLALYHAAGSRLFIAAYRSARRDIVTVISGSRADGVLSSSRRASSSTASASAYFFCAMSAAPSRLLAPPMLQSSSTSVRRRAGTRPGASERIRSPSRASASAAWGCCRASSADARLSV